MDFSPGYLAGKRVLIASFLRRAHNYFSFDLLFSAWFLSFSRHHYSLLSMAGLIGRDSVAVVSPQIHWLSLSIGLFSRAFPPNAALFRLPLPATIGRSESRSWQLPTGRLLFRFKVDRNLVASSRSLENTWPTTRRALLDSTVSTLTPSSAGACRSISARFGSGFTGTMACQLF